MSVAGSVAFDGLRSQGGHLSGRTEHLVDGFLARIQKQLIQCSLAAQAQKQPYGVRPRADRRQGRMRKLADEPRELPVLGNGVGKSVRNLPPQPFPARGLQQIDQGLGGARVVDVAQRPHCGSPQLLVPSCEQTSDVEEASRVGEDPYSVQGGQGHLRSGVVQVSVQPLQPLPIPVESGNQAMGGLERLNCQGRGSLAVCGGCWSRLRLEHGGTHDPVCVPSSAGFSRDPSWILSSAVRMASLSRRMISLSSIFPTPVINSWEKPPRTGGGGSI